MSAPLAFAQTTGTVKGVCKDIEGKPIARAKWSGPGPNPATVYKLKTNNKGEYFSLGIVPGKYNVKLSKDGKELFHFNGVTVGLDETTLDFDLKKEQTAAIQGQGMTAEQAAKAKEAARQSRERKEDRRHAQRKT